MFLMYLGEASQVLTPCVCAGAPCHWCWVVTSGDLLTFITLVTRLNQGQASEHGWGGGLGSNLHFVFVFKILPWL